MVQLPCDCCYLVSIRHFFFFSSSDVFICKGKKLYFCFFLDRCFGKFTLQLDSTQIVRIIELELSNQKKTSIELFVGSPLSRLDFFLTMYQRRDEEEDEQQREKKMYDNDKNVLMQLKWNSFIRYSHENFNFIINFVEIW